MVLLGDADQENRIFYSFKPFLPFVPLRVFTDVDSTIFARQHSFLGFQYVGSFVSCHGPTLLPTMPRRVFTMSSGHTFFFISLVDADEDDSLLNWSVEYFDLMVKAVAD